MIHIGLVGCGAVVHELYSKTLVGRDAYAVRFVHDLDPAQARSAARLLGAQAVGLDELLNRAEAVLVSTPPSSHSSLVRSALRPERPILCEKPFVTRYEDALSLIADARAAGARLYVGQFRRAFPQLELARELVAMGFIGDVNGFSGSEGGRFTWRAVSNYTTQDPNGGVLWDTGAHTLDMALFAAGLDDWKDVEVHGIRVEKDKEEPSHDFLADFVLEADGRTVGGHIHVSRVEALPNLVRVFGTRGEVAFSVAMDQRVRVTTTHGSKVLVAERFHADLAECFDLQMQRILLSRRADDFSADRFLSQVKVMEALSHAG